MGLRGPRRNPNSRRGRAEAEKAAKLAAIAKTKAPAPVKPTPKTAPAGSPECPEWLSPDQAELFASLVTDLEAAQVPIKHIDAHAIMMAVQCLSAVKDAGTLFADEDLDPKDRLVALKLKTQAGKDLMQWLQLICATPGARARIGLKTEAPKKLGVLAQMLALKQGRKS